MAYDASVAALQATINRYAAAGYFKAVGVDGRWGSNTQAGVWDAMRWIENNDDIYQAYRNTFIGLHRSWDGSLADLNELEIPGKLSNLADTVLRLPYPTTQVKPAVARGDVVSPPKPAQSSTALYPSTSASLVDTWRALATWKKIALGALAGALLLFLHGRYKRSRGLSGMSTLYLYTYRNKHGAYSDVWAHDADHARDQIKRKKDRPGGFFTISRVTNVPARKVA
jgi:hypothetical protein